MANRTSFAPESITAAFHRDENIATPPVNPVSPQIITEDVTVVVVRPGPNTKKKVAN